MKKKKRKFASKYNHHNTMEYLTWSNKELFKLACDMVKLPDKVEVRCRLVAYPDI